MDTVLQPLFILKIPMVISVKYLTKCSTNHLLSTVEKKQDCIRDLKII